MSPAPATAGRLDVRVYGRVQGVGFRPWVHGLASALDLTGWVRNDGGGVHIEVQGAGTRLHRFVDGVRRGPPGLARVERVEVSRIGPLAETRFEIRDSDCAAAGGAAQLPPDTAACAACLDELFDPADRRHRYAFINCTECGPRYTIAERLPYDRERTSMARFALCDACRREYGDPSDRRFHAEATACPACGPRLALLDAGGAPAAGGDAVAAAVARLRDGAIVAVKGVGGFHLACDARDAAAVARLRARKRREARPLALMALNAASIAPYAEVDAAGRALLESAERPIVLLAKRAGCDDAFPGVAPGVGALGVMLPYAPLHHLLFHEAAGRPAGTAWLERAHRLALVMTSGNVSGEPILTGNAEALGRLGGIADAFLVHDRGIVARCDDSVVQPRRRGVAFARRARGFVPAAIALPAAAPPVLALGGWLKSTACATRGADAFLSPHVGDLGSVASVQALSHSVEHLLELTGTRPRVIAHDLHPDYPSTTLAGELARRFEVPAVGVQHHHAHVAAVAAEHGVDGSLLGLALDGVGLGSDGGAWGGELLLCDRGFERLGSLRPLALPGGDRAAREPWRMAASALHALGRPERIAAGWPGEAGVVLRQMLDAGLNCPPTSSAGRLFDAAAALLGVCERNRYEAEAAMRLEALARRHGPVPPLPGGWRIDDGERLDLLPLLGELADVREPERGAALLHATLAAGLAQWAARAAGRHDVRRVALAGGCFMNALLSEALRDRLEALGLEVLEARRAPPGDGGLSLGQAWVAARQATDGR